MTQELLKYFKNDELAAEAWYKKYRVGEEKLPFDMHTRLAYEYARIEYNYLKNNSRLANRIDTLSEYGQMRFKDMQYYVDTYSEHQAIEQIANEFYQLFNRFKQIIPGGSIMANLGSPAITSLSNCFVVGQPEDTLESIFDYARDESQLYKRRGGAGIDISKLRPRNAEVNNASKTSTGSVSFMNLFSDVTKLIGQEGRRGALMISIDVNHPDIMEFITIKQDLTKVTGANVSIKTNAEFMKAVENDEDYLLTFPTDWKPKVQSDRFFTPNTDKLMTDGLGHYWRKVRAKVIWNTMIEAAHKSAEPGILFWDNHLKADPSAVYDQYRPVSTNPCGEIPLQPKDSCRLSAVNLFSIVRNPFTEDAFVDYEYAYSLFYDQLALSDNLVDLEVEAVERIINKINDPGSKEHALWMEVLLTGKRSRRVGNGFTALADMFAALSIPYGGEFSKRILKDIMEIKLKAEIDATVDLAILRDSFTGWNGMEEYNFDEQSVWGKNKFFQHILEVYPEGAARMMKYGRRNVSWSTVAPTGTVSIMAQTSSGIEPVFKPYYIRRMKVSDPAEATYTDVDGQQFKEFVIVHPKLQEFGELEFPLLVKDNTKAGWEAIYTASPYYKSTSEDIHWKDRLEIQQIVQQNTSHSISSTLNLPASTTIEEVDHIYRTAYHMDLKGITIYREGSRGGVLVDANTNSSKEKFSIHKAPKRGKSLPADIHFVTSQGIRYAVMVGLMDGKPYEVFVREVDKSLKIDPVQGEVIKEKKGHYKFVSTTFEMDNIQDPLDGDLEKKMTTLYISMLLRTGADLKFVIKTAKKVDDHITSFTSAFCRVLSKYVPKEVVEGEVCPDCGEPLMHEAGCVKCTSCTYSKCLILYSVKNN